MKNQIFNAVCKTRYLALLVLLIFTCGNVWGADKTVTWTATNGALGGNTVTTTTNATGNISTGSYSWDYTRSYYSHTSTNTDAVGWQGPNGGKKYIQLGKNGFVEELTLTTSNIPGTIKSVTVDCASYSAKHNVAISVGGTSYLSSTATPSWSNNTGGTKTGTGTSSGTITISFTGTGDSRALYINSVSVTYNNDDAASVATPTFSVAAGTYTSVQSVTISCATAESTIYYTTDGTTPTSSSTVYSSAISISSSCTLKAIAKKGSDYSSVASASYTINIPYTVSFSTGTGNPSVSPVTETEQGEGIALPAGPTPACSSDGWTFAGWGLAEVNDVTTAPRLLMPGDTYYPESNETLYAVYRKLTSGTSSATFTASNLSNLTQISSSTTSPGWWIHTATGVEFYINSYGYSSSYSSFDIWESWALIDAHTKIKQVVFTNYSSYTINSVELNSDEEEAGGSATLTGTTTQTITCSGDVSQLYLNSPAAGDSYFTSFTVTYYNAKYNSNPTYCTPLGTINGAVSLSNAGCNPGELKATWKMNATTGITSQTLRVYNDVPEEVTSKRVTGITASTSNQTITISGLNPCKEYYVTVENVSSGGEYCAAGDPWDSNVETTLCYTYTINKTNVSLKSGDTEATSTCDDFLAEYVASSGYTLPTTITVTGASSYEWTSGVLSIEAANVTGNVTVTITGVSSSCSGAYSLHTGNSGAGGWITNQCFEDADWGHVDDAIWVGEFPSTNAVYVGYAGGSSYYGAEWAVGGIKTYDIPGGRTLGWNSSNYYSDYPATAIGTFHIYKNSTEVNGNYYLRFKPTTYVLRTGANSTWTSQDMTISATNSNYYETAPLTLTSTLISEHAYVDLKANNGEGHVWCNFSNDRTASGNVKVKNGASTFRGTDLQASDNGTYGKFQIDITQDVDNWKLAFVPMYRITYAAGTGASGSMEPSSYQDVGGTIAAAANGFTAAANKQFAGWSGSDGNSYAAGDNVTMNSDVTLTAQWEWIPVTAITISNSTLDKYVDDANVTLTVTSVTPSGASSSVTWLSSNPSVATVNNSTGEVDFLAVGTTTITATSTVSSGITATCAVTVWAKPSATFVDNLQNLTEDKDGNALSGYNLTAVAGTPVVFPVLANQAKGSSTCEDQHYRFVGWTTSDNNTDPQDHLVTSHTLANGDAITYYAVWADGVEGASYTRLTSNTFKTSPTKYVIGADDGEGTDLFFYSCEKTDQNNSWGYVSSDPSTDAPIQFTLSGSASELVVASTEATTRYLKAASGKQFFGMSSSSTTVVLGSGGTIESTADTYNNLRYNYNSGSGGLRWYTGTSNGTAVYFYEVGAGSTVHYRTSCCTNKVEAPDVTATKTSTNITLTWGDETGATGWEVSWNGGAFGSPSGTRTHTVSGLTPNTTYTWQVRATYDPLVKCGADIASGSTTTNQVYHVTYAKGDESANCNATGSTTDATAYEAGDPVTLQGNEFHLSGYTFNAWTTDDPDVTISNNQITMPDHDVVITATWNAVVDKYFDRMHDQTDASHGGREETESGPNEGKYYIQMTGCNYAVPIAVDRNTGDACQTTHYKLQGWIAASHMKGYPNNMDGTIKTGEETNIFPPTGTKTATGATYYAIWAKVTE